MALADYLHLKEYYEIFCGVLYGSLYDFTPQSSFQSATV
jgi:hypothetical protein